MSLPRYPDYKPSGVEWLGEVPGHWEVKPVKKLASIVNGYPFDSALFDAAEGFPLIRIRDLNKLEAETFYKGEFVENAAITSDDVLIGMDGDFNVGRWRGAGRALLNQRMCCVRGKSNILTRLLEYALPIRLKAINDVTYATTVKHLASSQVEKTFVAIPPDTAEQTQIAAFLDRETAKIDGLVAEQRRLMELLKEKRQAVISHAVTQGLNPDAPMKPSGIEWLGDVPAHWEVSSFRHSISAMFNGLTADQVDESESTVPVTRIETISGGYITESRLGFIERENARDDRRLLAGDILFSNINSLSMIGNCAFYSGGREIYAGMNLLVFRPSTQRHPRWLYWLVRSVAFREVVESLAKPAINQASISQSSLNGIPVPIPPMNEQVEIAGYLEAEAAKFDTLTAEAQRAIDLLQERRTALISAAVTGQIDVRGIQALPQ